MHIIALWDIGYSYALRNKLGYSTRTLRLFDLSLRELHILEHILADFKPIEDALNKLNTFPIMQQSVYYNLYSGSCRGNRKYKEDFTIIPKTMVFYKKLKQTNMNN